MKKNTKILVFVLSLALIVGAAIGFSSSAETAAEGPEIMAKNVVYGGVLNFQFAIDATDLGADKTITVYVYEADPAEASPVDEITAEYTNVTESNLEVDYAYIATSKAPISAIAYGQEFWAVAECDGKRGPAVKYSAVEYFLERLYADADVITDIQKEHYENAIAYGSTAQKVVDIPTGTNVADYLYVGGKDAEVLIDGVSVGEGAIVLAGDKFALKPIGTIAPGYSPLWKDATGSTIKGTSEITASASGIYSYTLIPMLTFDGMNSVIPTVKTNTSVSSASQVFTTFGDDYAAYNKAFKIYNGVLEKNMPTASIVDEKLVVNSDDGSDYIKIYPTYTESGYNHTTFEADITFNCNTGNIGFDLLQSDNSTAVRFSTFTYNMSTGYFKMNATNASGGSGNTVDIYLDTTGDNAHTLNLKVDHYKLESDILVAFWLNGTLKYIIDSRLATDATTGNIDSKNTDGILLSGTRYYPYSGTAAGKEAVKTDFSQFSLNPNSNFSGSIAFDNILFTQTVTTEAPEYNTTLK